MQPLGFPTFFMLGDERDAAPVRALQAHNAREKTDAHVPTLLFQVGLRDKLSSFSSGLCFFLVSGNG